MGEIGLFALFVWLNSIQLDEQTKPDQQGRRSTRLYYGSGYERGTRLPW
jgi:hypothetical protein